MAPTNLPTPTKTTITTTHKTLVTTPNPFEQRFGYHRAVRRGPLVCVSGTTAVKVLAVGSDVHADAEGDGHGNQDELEILHRGDAHMQAKTAMGVAVEAVKGFGGKLEDVVRVRMFVAVSIAVIVVVGTRHGV